MSDAIAVRPKKRGRPATGRDPLVCIRLPAATTEAIDQAAEKVPETRSDFIRQAIEAELKRRGRKR